MGNKLLFCLLVLGTWPSSVFATMSFKEWKSSKFNDAAQKINQTRLEISKNQKDSDTYKSLLERLSQDEWNLEIAHELRVADYFELYLLPLETAEKFQEAANKMSSVEVADLMAAYAKTLSSHKSQSEAQSTPEILSQPRRTAQDLK